MNRVFLISAAALLASGPVLADGDHSYATVTFVGAASEGFASAGGWEASLYTGAEEGDEASGRVTDWVEMEEDMVSFRLPDDLREDADRPEGADAYFRLRSTGDDYPGFDMVSPAFEVGKGNEVIMDMSIRASSWTAPIED